jgi:putative hydrolase of the HAD superfamily
MQVGFPWLEPEEPHLHLDTPDRWWAALAETFARAFRGIDIADDRAHALTSRVRGVYLDPTRWRRYDDVLPVLEALTAAGWRHVILSNHVPELPDIVQAVGLRDHFEHIFNSADLGYEKPHPRTFDAVLAAVGSGAERIWMIGDSYRADVRGAEAAGIPAILVRRPHPEAHRFAETLAEIPGMLR